MGNSQFYSPIKSSVDSIQTATGQIQTAVNQLQQTDVANLNTKVSNLGWWGKYTKQLIEASLSPALTNYVNVSGKSGLFAIGFDAASSIFLSGLKIVVDGVTVENWTGNKYSFGASQYYRYGAKTLGITANVGGVSDATGTGTVTRKMFPGTGTQKDTLDSFVYFPFATSLSIDAAASAVSGITMTVGVYSQ